MCLYHKDVFWLDRFNDVVTKNHLTYGYHADGQIKRRGIDETLLPTVILEENVISVVEVETLYGKVIKQVIRHKYDNEYDLVLAVTNTGTVKTVWLNSRTDTHKTLDKSKYTDHNV